MNLSAFAEDEVTRLFEDRRNSDEIDGANNDLENNEIIEIQEEENKLDLATAFLLYQSELKTEKVVIVQRDQRQIWQMLFRQNFDLSKRSLKVRSKRSLKVRFAGEVAEDLGGLIREFLTLCMRRFPDLGFMVFGSRKCLCFTANTEVVLAEKYYKLGKVVVLSILTIGTGPECLHPAIVRSMFQVQQLEVIENIKDAFITQDLEGISKGNYDPLFDANINTIGAYVADLQEAFVFTTVLRKFSAIKQFIDDISSLCKDLTSVGSLK